MAYIDRDGSNNIKSVFKNKQYEDQEYISDDDEEYVNYIASSEAQRVSDEEKDAKISLKMRIDAGTALGEDMSAEQAELDALMGG